MTRPHHEARLRGAIQVTQVALALVLLSGAGLFSKSFGRLMTADPGYDAGQILRLELVRLEELRGEAATLAFARELDERLAALPGISSISRAWPRAGSMHGITLETSDSGPWEPAPNTLPFLRVDTAYFRTMGIGIAEGRAFSPSDIAAGEAVVIDQDLARALWPNESAVGRRFRIRSDPWLTVVGVTEDVQLDGPREPLGPHLLFYPATQEDLRSDMIVIRSTTDPATLASAVRDLVAAVDPDQPIRNLQTGAEATQETIADPRLLAVITTVIAGAATFLAAVGIFGLISFSVSQRQREIGVRVALGARSRRVMFEVLQSAFRLGVLGIVIGLAVMLFAGRFLAGLLYQTTRWDPGVLVMAALTLLAACTIAVWGPARRAARVDPAEALRAE